MNLLYISLIILCILCFFYLLRAANTFFIGRKIVNYSFLKKSIFRDSMIGLGILPLFMLLNFVKLESFTNENELQEANATFLLGRYTLTTAKGNITLQKDGDEQAISIQYKNGSKLTGKFRVFALDSTSGQVTFKLDVTGEWYQKRKTSPYQHSFNGVLESDALSLTSTSDNTTISAIRQPKL